MLFALLLGTGCNQVEYFNVAGYEQATFSNDADVIFVIDNSLSMADESASLALNINSFVEILASDSGAAQEAEDLNDAVNNYVDSTLERGRFIDYQLSLTTTSVDYAAAGETEGIDPGEFGTLVGQPQIISKYDDEVANTFRRNLLCDATVWRSSELPSDLSYECGTEPDQITQDYLNCECGFGEWEGSSGAPTEKPLEAALLAMCRSVEEPPEACFSYADPLSGAEEPPALSTGFAQADIGSNNVDGRSLIRDNSTVVFVIVSDEADTSAAASDENTIARLVSGDEDPTVYIEAFEDFDRPVRFVVIGPNYDPENNNIICNSGGAVTWAAERLDTMVTETGGFYAPLATEVNGNCEDADFSDILSQLGELLNNLLTSFQLQSYPDVETIRVYVDGAEIDKAAEADILDPSAEALEYTRGWSYDSSQNAVAFWGANIPDYNADVRIFFRPLVDKPRALPF
jgi:hypothetical protein